MDLDLGDSESVPCYALVFNDIVLDEHWDWTDVPGVSFTEPNFITVVTYDRPVHYMGTVWIRFASPQICPGDPKPLQQLVGLYFSSFTNVYCWVLCAWSQKQKTIKHSIPSHRERGLLTVEPISDRLADL